MARTKVAFLYSEVAGYFLACADKLVEKADVLVVRWPVNNEAPFELTHDDRVQIKVKSDYSVTELEKMIHDFNPDIIVCSGWMDKDYLKIVKGFNKNIKRVLTLDNHWRGDLKQRMAQMISPFYLKRIFSHAWVPGKPQENFAKKLGFSGKILKGFYCADTDLFDKKYQRFLADKRTLFPKRFLYVARYVKHKGIFEMWQAFTELQQESPNEWELWCLGTGEEWENRIEHEKIRHFGFVQPKDLDDFIAETGVYILPSAFEPWGVSVQEFAIAGLPLILSDAVGSKEAFLKDNGFEFKAGDMASLKKAMKEIMEMDEASLLEMADKSHLKGMEYTTENWVERLLSLKN